MNVALLYSKNKLYMDCTRRETLSTDTIPGDLFISMMKKKKQNHSNRE